MNRAYMENDFLSMDKKRRSMVDRGWVEVTSGMWQMTPETKARADQYYRDNRELLDKRWRQAVLDAWKETAHEDLAG